MNNAIRDMTFNEAKGFIMNGTHERWHFWPIREEIKKNKSLLPTELEKLIEICDYCQDGYPDLAKTVN